MAFETQIGTLDFARCEAYAKTRTVAQLQWAAKDAKAAAEVWGLEDGTNYGKYIDEYFTYADEIRRRRGFEETQ